MQFKVFLGILASLLLASCSFNSSQSAVQNSKNFCGSYNKPRTLDYFNDYVQFLKSCAKKAGVSRTVLNAQNNIQYIPKTVKLDWQQAGRIKKNNPNVEGSIKHNGVTKYLNRVLTQKKVNTAVERYWQMLPQLEKVSKKYGVQKSYLIALWGMESGFGRYQGTYDVLSALATLAFDGRRESFFAKEFVIAMKMLEGEHIKRENMRGSWAGAMGQTQFMPSSYFNYAVDGDKDGKKDIWKNYNDIFASIANYLHIVGWNDKLPWGIEVQLSQPLDLALSGTEKDKKRRLQAWQKLGVTPKLDVSKISQKLTALSNADLWLIRPDREVGRAFLVSNNFRTLLDWNKSNNFAISIGMFADRIEPKIGQ